jgi:LysR family transcriptional regulator, hypochlorite-specific transcription factor HypT
MEFNWIEDFLSVAETGNFTRSAQLRHLTQPALSRRIRALETWLGADLIDRGSYPTRLTPAGELFREQAVAILERVNGARALVRHQAAAQQAIRFALPHTLSLSFFPRWLTQVHGRYGVFASRVVAGNVHDAVMNFVEGNSDLLLCYYHPSQPIDLDARRYPSLALGIETVRAYSRCDAQSQPQFRFGDGAATRVPFLNYSPQAYLRRVVDRILEQVPAPQLLPQHETAMAEGLKNMVLEGHGVAFLPASTVAQELRKGTLCAVGGEDCGAELEIRLYKDSRREHAAVHQLWDFLSESGAAM